MNSFVRVIGFYASDRRHDEAKESLKDDDMIVGEGVLLSILLHGWVGTWNKCLYLFF